MNTLINLSVEVISKHLLRFNKSQLNRLPAELQQRIATRSALILNKDLHSEILNRLPLIERWALDSHDRVWIQMILTHLTDANIRFLKLESSTPAPAPHIEITPPRIEKLTLRNVKLVSLSFGRLTHLWKLSLIKCQRISLYLQELTSLQNLSHLHLDENKITLRGSLNLITFLNSSTSLQELTLRNCELWTADMIGIIKSLTSIRSLYLDNSLINPHSKYTSLSNLTILADLLTSHSTLKVVSLSRLLLGNQALPAIAKNLSTNTVLTSLNLSMNGFTISETAKFIPCLNSNTTLTVLNLSLIQGPSGLNNLPIYKALPKVLHLNRLILHQVGHTSSESTRILAYYEERYPGVVHVKDDPIQGMRARSHSVV